MAWWKSAPRDLALVGAAALFVVAGRAAALAEWSARPATDPAVLRYFVDPMLAVDDPAFIEGLAPAPPPAAPDAPDPLPDGETVVATSCDGTPRTGPSEGAGCSAGATRLEAETGVRAVAYAAPTDRYRHGVLGDRIEAGALYALSARDGGDPVGAVLRLPPTEVFEDRFPRIADLDGDGVVEVTTIRASLSAGGAVTVYNLIDGAIVERATTPFIGTPNRWLNIAGIADFLGDGSRQIAYVEKPHIGGTLYVLKLEGDALTFVGEMAGFSNHVIGSRELGLSAVADIDADGRWELALPSFDRRALRIVGFDDGVLAEIARVDLPGRVVAAIGALGEGREARFILGLDTGAVLEVAR